MLFLPSNGYLAAMSTSGVRVGAERMTFGK